MALKNYGKLNIPDWIWWVGVIENRIDLAKSGRYQVRIMGYHTADTEILPTKDLPYAAVINSVTNASTSGIMENSNLLPGSTVVGFFADGNDGQMPVIIGSIAGWPKEKNEDLTIEDGFNDPNKNYPRGGFGEPAEEGFAGAGEPDISRLARDEVAETHYSLMIKRAEREIDIRTAAAPDVTGQLPNKTDVDYEGQKWEEPYARAQGPYKTFEMEEFTPKYWDALADLKSGGTGAPKEPGTYTSMYPWNQVRETEAGFVTEIDNTAGNERSAWYHPNGNYEEVQADGTRVNRIQGSDYEIVAEDKNVFIRGSCNVTILGDAKMLVTGNKYEEVEGDYFISVLGDRVTAINGSDIRKVTTDVNDHIGGERTARVSLNDDLSVMGKQTQTIQLSKTETVKEDVTENFKAKHIQNVDGNKSTTVIGTNKIIVGTSMITGVEGNVIIGASEDMTINADNNMDIDALVGMTIDAPTMTIDSNNMSIDGVLGNITSNNVRLHTHTHGQTGGTNPDSDKDVDTKAPTSGT